MCLHEPVSTPPGSSSSQEDQQQYGSQTKLPLPQSPLPLAELSICLRKLLVMPADIMHSAAQLCCQSPSGVEYSSKGPCNSSTISGKTCMQGSVTGVTASAHLITFSAYGSCPAASYAALNSSVLQARLASAQPSGRGHFR
jgi:hypothetical protein